MRFTIQHSLRYRYERPVFLEPHTLRLTPRQDPAQRLLRFSVEVHPAVCGRSACLDADGNSCEVLWFDELLQELDLTVEMEVETLRQNPFDWIITEAPCRRLPLRYSPALQRSLQPFLQAEQPVDPAVAAWAAAALRPAVPQEASDAGARRLVGA